MSDRKQNLLFFSSQKCNIESVYVRPHSLYLSHTHIHRVNVVLFIFYMKHLVPLYLTIFQNAIIVCVFVQIWPPHS